MAIFDVIKFDGLTSREWLIYKHPSDQIVLGSQLIVQEGQVAIFLKGGTIADIFYPGTYTLGTNNLPLLTKLINMPFGGNTPFAAEIYFINTVTKLDVYWGTTDPIQLIDPKYFVKLRIRAYGQMGVKPVDYAMFFSELIGGMSASDFIKYDKIKEFYKGLIVLKVKSIIAETIVNEKISALEISTKLEDISNKSKEKLHAEFEKYGLRVTNFYVQSINFPDEDFDQINAILSNKAEFEIMGDNRYVTKRSFDVYEGAASNENGVAGAFAAGGLGLGVGMNLAGNVNSPALNTEPNTVPCSSCGTQNATGARFCLKCGNTLGAPTKSCPNCNSVIPQNSCFCSSCGFKFVPNVCECGEPLAQGAAFCSKCGKKVE